MKGGFTYRKCEGCWDWRKRGKGLLGSGGKKPSSERPSSSHLYRSSYEDTSSTLTQSHTNRLYASSRDLSQSLKSFTGRRSPRSNGTSVLASPRQMMAACTAPHLNKGHAVIPQPPAIDYYALSLKLHFEQTVEKSVHFSSARSRETMETSREDTSREKLRVSELRVSGSCPNCAYLLTKGFSARHCSLHQ
jgi:hypothetical protein